MVGSLLPPDIKKLREELDAHLQGSSPAHRELEHWLEAVEQRWRDDGAFKRGDIERLERVALPLFDALLKAPPGQQSDLIADICRIPLGDSPRARS